MKDRLIEHERVETISSQFNHPKSNQNLQNLLTTPSHSLTPHKVPWQIPSNQTIIRNYTFIPTIDISKGNAVLVKQGQVERIHGSPIDRAEFLSIHKHFLIVDIDAARGEGNNKELIKTLTQKYSCYVGGGIRTLEDAIDYLNASARRVVISSHHELILSLPKDRVILALDIDNDFKLLSHGRKKCEDKHIFEILDLYHEHVELVSITFHQQEGSMQGLPMQQVSALLEQIHQKNYRFKLIVAGGIHSIDEFKELSELNVIPQFGAGLWNDCFTLGDVFASIVNAEKQQEWVVDQNTPLFPCVVQNTSGVVLGLVWCTPESIKISVDTRIATFFSRDRKRMWTKGETSGNYCKVKGLHLSCDGSSLRMIVEEGEPKKNFCHLNQHSCFGQTDPVRGSLKSIQSDIMDKIKHRKGSYTNQVLNNEQKIISKILEESLELICAKEETEIVHETSDLLYFILLYLKKNNVSIQSLERKLIKRQYAVIKDPSEILIKERDKFKIGVVITNLNDPKHPVIDFISKVLEVKIEKKKVYTSVVRNSTKSDRNYEYICDNSKIKIIPVKPKDISVLINNEFIDAVVSYEDIILNYPINVMKIHNKHSKGSKIRIVVAGKKGETIEKLREINKRRKLIIMAEYVKLANDWVRNHKLKAKIITASGSSESYLVNDLCDLCVVVTDTNETLNANDLEVIDTLVTTSMHLFVAPSQISKLEEIMSMSIDSSESTHKS